jgi:threonine/homoserine/homoserine lactone efflux protein
MKFNPKALLVFVGFGVLFAVALSSNGDGWSHIAEAVSTVVILLGVAGFLREDQTRAHRHSS